MKLNIIVKSGINSDGFNTVIKDGDNVIEEKSWNYGYNCSYDKMFANKQEPYVTDVLQDLINKYNVDEFSVEAGKNVFAKKDVASHKVEEFKNKYCSELYLSGVDLNTPDEDEFIPREVWVAEDACIPDIMRKHVQDRGKLYMIDEPKTDKAYADYNMAHISTDVEGHGISTYVPLNYVRSVTDEDMDFVDAVASITVNEQGMEQ